MSATYRDHDIVHKDGNFYISKDGMLVCQQPSMEFAQKWIDEQHAGPHVGRSKVHNLSAENLTVKPPGLDQK